MPHDFHGTEFKVGDIVNIPCKIKEIHQTEEYCNITVETCQPMYPTENRNIIVLNGRQVVIKPKG